MGLWQQLRGYESRLFDVVRRVAMGCYTDGSIHAGNLAYMSLLAIFPFFIAAGAVATMTGERGQLLAAIASLAAALPPAVAVVIEPAAYDVIDARSGWLLWVGAAIGLWTTASLIETLRDIVRRAYHVKASQPFWKYRVGSIGIIFAAMLLLVTSLVAQVTIAAAQAAIASQFPELAFALDRLALSRLVAVLILVAALWMLFAALAPANCTGRRFPKWPGAVLVALWWFGVSEALPPVLRSIFTYNLTYGSLAGVMITLFFFWLVGLGLVAGAELNAALAYSGAHNGAHHKASKPEDRAA